MGESKGDRLLWIQGPRLAVALFVFVLVGGTIGYVAIEEWSPWDAFYMTVITVTTVGYREVHALSRAGQVFTTLLAVTGVGAAFYTFSLLLAAVVQGGLHRRLHARRLMHMINELTNHFILCGSGRIGSMIADEFRRQSVPFVIIERDPERARAVLERGDLAVEADASREEVLKRVGIDRARGLIAAVGTDAENVYTVLTARVMRPDLYIIGRADSEDAGRKLIRAGADRVVSPYQIGARQLAQTALRPAVVEFVQLATSAESLELAMEQIRIDAGSQLVGRSLVDANLRQRFGVIVVAIQRSGGRMEFNPSSDAVMLAADQLIVLGRPENLRDLESVAQPQ